MRLRMSVRDMPLLLDVGVDVPWLLGNWLSGCGSRGARAGVVLCASDRLRKGGRSYVPTPVKGRSRGECAGVARGVWSGVGDKESWEKVGDDGAVELGEFGLDRLACRYE